jgi:AraC-like DNA-binding protein
MDVWSTGFIRALVSARLAIMRQSVAGAGQFQSQSPSTNTLHDVHTPKRLGAIPTATGALARLAYTRAREAGLEPNPLLKKAGLTHQQIKDCNARVTVRRQIQFLNLVANDLHDRFLGFHLAQMFDLREAGYLYYVPASSENLGDALQRIARFSSIANEGLSLKYLENQDIRFVFDYVGVARHLDRHQIEFFMTLLVRLCRHVTGLHLRPTSVRFTHRRGNESSELAAYFGGELDFAASVDELDFSGTVKDLKVVSADPFLNKLLVAHCEEALSQRPRNGGSFRSAVQNAIVPLLPHGEARASVIAKKLGLSQRTMARRLSLEDLTFSDVLDSLRGDLAREYLADPGLSISRIAWLLGYQEVSAFTHAFKRWTGTTPRQARPQSREIGAIAAPLEH